MRHHNGIGDEGTLIRGGIVVTAGRGGDVFMRGDVWLRGETIEKVGPSEDIAPPEGWTVIDATDAIVMPGFVDNHRHIWQTPLRGLAADLTAPEYRGHLRGRFGPHYTPDDLYIATLAGALEALDGGITTIFDWAHIMNGPEYADASIAALRDTGMRAVFGYGTPTDADADAWYRNSSLTHPDDVRRVRQDVLSDDTALVTLAVAARAPFQMSSDVMAHDWRLARELSLRISVDGGLGGGIWGGRHYPIRALRDAGLMGDDTTYVHCNNLADDEYQAIADSGGHVSISPGSEMHVGHGVPAIAPLMRVGVRPALSVDFVTQYGGDMFGAMRGALETERGVRGREAFEAGRGVDPWPLRTDDVLDFATQRGANSLGVGSRIGSLEPGKQADIVLIDTASLRLSPVNDPVATIVLQASPGDVDTVLVGGRVVKRNGSLMMHDASKVRIELIASRDRLYGVVGMAPGERAGGGSTEAWAW